MPFSHTAEAPAARAPAGPCSQGPIAQGEWQAPVQRLLQAVVGLARARAGALRLLDPGSGALLLVSAVGALDVARLDVQQQPGGDCGVCSEALRMDQARCAAAACACARAMAAPDRPSAEPEERVFVLPLHHGASPCGVLNLFFDQACEVPTSLQALLPALGDMLGLALENHRLARRALQDSVTVERLMLAGEVHDSLAQSLTWMRMRLALLRSAIDQGDRVSAERCLKDLDQSLAGAHGRMRELIADFRTRMDPQGLPQALQQVVQQLRGVAEVDIEICDEAGGLELGAEQELQVFHIVREALVNVAKHARARHARVRLARRHGQIRIDVDDDGVGPGCDERDGSGAARRGDHFGLDLMRERARLIGGRIELVARSDRGTSLRLSFPDPRADPTPTTVLRTAHG